MLRVPKHPVLATPGPAGTLRAVEIRAYDDTDWPRVWPIVRQIVRAADTFPYDPDMTEEEARDIWIERPPGLTVVASDAGRVLGTAKMGPNKPGPASHISTASFMVPGAARGKGVGTALCCFALDWARAHGYAGMQFNAVVETNRAAVDIYKRLGFELIGTVPGAFDHPDHGRVGLHIMYIPF
jgi:GNAT superfamily N-acetyltransferase